MTETDKDILRQGLFEAIEIQMRDGTPPETKRTFDRLVGEGYSKDDAMAQIANALTVESANILGRDSREYDEDAYVRELRALPELPPDVDEAGRQALHAARVLEMVLAG